MKHDIQWHSAPPLWRLALQDSGAPPLRFDRPAILRFSGDNFMDQLSATLARDASRLAEFAVRQETWRDSPGSTVGWLPQSDFLAEDPPKLYQPAHNRFYLITGGLVCRTFGLPDRLVDPGKGHAVSLLMRRLAPKQNVNFDPKNSDTYDELGWVGNRQKGGWAFVSSPETVAVDGEERLPLFPSAFQDRDRTRRIWAGLIPAGGRELYESGAAPEPSANTAGDRLSDPRAATFQAEVTDALSTLSKMTASPVAAVAAQLGFTLVSFSDFLQRELLAVWNVLGGNASLSGAPDTIADALRNTSINASIAANSRTWASLLLSAAGSPFRTALFSGTIPSPIDGFTRDQICAGATAVLASGGGEPGWLALVDEATGDHRVAELKSILTEYFATLPNLPPSFSAAAYQEKLMLALLPLAAYMQRELGTVWSKISNPTQAISLSTEESALATYLQANQIRSTSWASLLVEAAANRPRIESGVFDRRLKAIKQSFTRSEIETMAAGLSGGGLASLAAAAFLSVPVLVPVAGSAPAPGETFYVGRLIYEDPICRRTVVSKPSRPFRLAEFYDPDAPVRPTRIRLPVDTSFEGLRKFPKAVTMLMSDQLRRQTAQARDAGLKGLSDGGSGSDPGPGLGLICSFSIPIITICAMILLMIIVQLLNIIFWWIPLFRICLPLNLKAKA